MALGDIVAGEDTTDSERELGGPDLDTETHPAGRSEVSEDFCSTCDSRSTGHSDKSGPSAACSSGPGSDVGDFLAPGSDDSGYDDV